MDLRVKHRAGLGLAVVVGGVIILGLVLLFGLLRRETTIETTLPVAGGVKVGDAVLIDKQSAGEVLSREVTPEGVRFRLRVRGVGIGTKSEVVLYPSRPRQPAVVEVRTRPGPGAGSFVRLPGRVAYDVPAGFVDPPFLTPWKEAS